MTPRSLLLAWVVPLALGAACRHTTIVDPRLRRGAKAPALEETGAGRARGLGAAPGDEKGPGRFVDRREARTFDSAGGGRLWYYLNLYYWAPNGTPGEGTTQDLWIKARVVERFVDLKRWPDAVAAESPEPKTTLEYWEVGVTGRSVSIDNHKDFWLLASNWCEGAIDVTITLEIGRVRVRDATGAWARPRAHYVLDRRDYGKAAGLRAGDARFQPLEREPINVWNYRIPWSSTPAKLTRSAWESLEVPRLRLTSREFAPRPPVAPVVTDDR